MNAKIEAFAAEVAQTTGAALPAVLDDQSPPLRRGEEPFYLVGLIGGKEVGKSAIVNALVGERITTSTSYGPGTEVVVAYVHQDQAAAVKSLLDREAPAKHAIVTHKIDRLRRQVLLDLPDIDSQYADHIELTRRMLRHMLFPVWVQSIEKYADQQPQKLLAAVAQGNDPANFLFALNKADQLKGDASAELRDDFATRIARVIKRSTPPRVFLVSALQPDAFDFTMLRDLLAQQKSDGDVHRSIELAGRQHERSVLEWVETQRLGERAARLKRLEEDAAEVVAARLTSSLLEGAVPRILDDPGHRAAMVDQVMSARVARWPVVNILHTLLWPLTSFWRANVGSGPTATALVAAKIDDQARPLAANVAATFALLQQTHPPIGPLYRQQKLWDDVPANAAAAQLQQTLAGALEAQHADAITRLARGGVIMPLVRWTLTIGAILWFPIIQPLLELLLSDSLPQGARRIALLVVQLLSSTYLLKSAAFLAIWFVVLWMLLRWDTQRRVNKLMVGWRRADASDASTSLPVAVIEWADELLDPIHAAREREESLAGRADELRDQLTDPAAA